MSSPTSSPRFLIVEARFYTELADALATGAMRALDAAGASYDRISVPGALEIPAAIAMASQRADEIMRELDAGPDISSVAERVKTNVLQTRGALEKAASDLYKEVDQIVPASSLVDPTNSVILINKILEEVGGMGALTGKEKAFRNQDSI